MTDAAGSTAFGGLLDRKPTLATTGAAVFEDALLGQGATPLATRWQPAPLETARSLAVIAADPAVLDANATAVGRLTAAEPRLVSIEPARVALGLDRGHFLHAGPPIGWAEASGPLRGALIGAAMYEGLATEPTTAESAFARGAFTLEPCHHRRAVGPMAGVVSASMPMFELVDEVHDATAYCTLNEGLGQVLRYGAYSPDVLDRLKWMESVLAPVLGDVLQQDGPIDVTGLVAQALQMGDEGHNRNRAGTSLFLREILPTLIESEAPATDRAAVARFITGNDHFFLNLVMPAAKAAADAGRGVAGSSVVVAMARNGTEFGIQLSGTGDRWFTAPCGVPVGLLFPGYTSDDANPDIGDSTITETAGLGGFAMAAAPAIVRFVGGQVADANRATLDMYQITVSEHPRYQLPTLDFRGTPVGIDAALVARTGLLPAVNTGIAGRQAGTGQIGAGLVEPPLSCFLDAVDSLASSLGKPM